MSSNVNSQKKVTKTKRQKKQQKRTQRNAPSVVKKPIKQKINKRYTTMPSSKGFFDNNYDARVSRYITPDPTNAADVTNCVVNYKRYIQDIQASAIALSAINYVLSKGYMNYMLEVLGDRSHYSHLFNYIKFLVGQAAEGEVLATQSVPLWFNIILQAIRPKSIPIRGGKVSYAADQALNIGLIGNVLVNTITGDPVNSSLNFGSESNGTFGYYYKMYPPTTAYSQALGAAAFKVYMTFIQSTTSLRNHKMFQVVSTVDKNIGSNDASVFSDLCVLSNGKGTGFQGYGSILTYAGNYVPIKYPLLALLDTDPNESVPSEFNSTNRTSRCVSGDPYSLCGILQTIPDPRFLTMKNNLVFKFIDINPLMDLIYGFATQAFQTFYSNTTNYSNNYDATYLTNARCLLTQKDVRQMICGLLRYIFSNTAAISAGMGYLSTNGDFIPLQWGTNVAPSSQWGQVQLPISIYEMILSWSMRTVDGSYNPKTKKTNTYNPIILIPVLGIHTQDEVKGFITYQATINQLPYNTFSPETISPYPNPWDGYSAGNAYDMNMGTNVNLMVTNWNKWLQSLSSVIEGLCTYDTKFGLNALETISMTDLLIEVTDATLQFTDKVGPLKTTCSHPIEDTAWNKVQQFWIKPMIRLNGITSGESKTAWTPSEWSMYSSEYYKIEDAYGNGTQTAVTQTLGSRNVNHIRFLVKPQGSSTENSLTALLRQAESLGRGGAWGETVLNFTRGLGNTLWTTGVGYAADTLNRNRNYKPF